MFAIRLTDEFSKDQILDWYLNQINYGGVYNGVEAASDDLPSVVGTSLAAGRFLNVTSDRFPDVVLRARVPLVASFVDRLTVGLRASWLWPKGRGLFIAYLDGVLWR